MNGPNLLTLLRIFFVPLLVAALLEPDLLTPWLGRWLVSSEMFALVIFLAAAATDLTQEHLSEQAAMQAQASMPRTSLFDIITTTPSY